MVEKKQSVGRKPTKVSSAKKQTETKRAKKPIKKTNQVQSKPEIKKKPEVIAAPIKKKRYVWPYVVIAFLLAGVVEIYANLAYINFKSTEVADLKVVSKDMTTNDRMNYIPVIKFSDGTVSNDFNLYDNITVGVTYKCDFKVRYTGEKVLDPSSCQPVVENTTDVAGN